MRKIEAEAKPSDMKQDEPVLSFCMCTRFTTTFICLLLTSFRMKFHNSGFTYTDGNYYFW